LPILALNEAELNRFRQFTVEEDKFSILLAPLFSVNKLCRNHSMLLSSVFSLEEYETRQGDSINKSGQKLVEEERKANSAVFRLSCLEEAREASKIFPFKRTRVALNQHSPTFIATRA
jgi:hypothetical protein